MIKKKRTKKIHPVKSRKAGPMPSQKDRVFNRVHPIKSSKAGISPKAKLFNRVKMKKKKPKLPKEQISNGVHKTKIRVIGIGGGGGSIVSEIVSRIKRADFVVANTDARALRGIKKVKRFQFGQDLTHGLGTGMNTEVGELAAQNEKEKIKKLFEGQDLCIMVICLGGGTGSGAGPVFAKISKNLNCLTYGIFTMPFEFEGEKKMEIARESLEKIKSHLNIFSVIPNERIFQIIDKDTPLKDALSAINERLAENLEGLIEMVYLPGLINIDFADLRTILAGRGRLAYLNTTEIEEPKKEEAAKKVISTPLYSYTIKGARGILYNIVGGKTLQLSEVSQISRIISDSVNKNAKIIFGISQSSQYQNKIKITLLATGCGTKGVLLKPPRALKPRTPAVKKPQPMADQPKAGKPASSPPASSAKRGESQGGPVISLTTEKAKKETEIVVPEIKPRTTFQEKGASKQTSQKVVRGKPSTSPEKKKARQIIQKKPQSLKEKPKSKQRPKRKPKPKPKSKPRTTFQKKGAGKQTSQKVVRGKPKIFTKKKSGISAPSPSPSKEKIKSAQTLAEEKNEQKIRRNGLQLKKVIEEEEKELLEQEKVWETPAILRRKPK